MADQTPPPERELSEETRSRLRARLVEQTGTTAPERPPAPSWLIPAVAAAAVFAIAVGGFVLLAGGDTGSDQPDRSLGSGTANDPARTGGVQPPTKSQRSTAAGADVGTACDNEVKQFLPGGEQVSRIDYAEGSTYLYANDTKWVVCDGWAMGDGGPPTLIGDQRLGAEPSADTFALSMNFVPRGKKLASEYFSGGPLIDGVTGISYAFPGGDAQEATMNDQMWAMVYLPTKGAMAMARIPQEPAVVTVTYSDGDTDSYELPPTQWCAQLNHGC